MMIKFFKISGALEALSYLVLLFIAMPLKYVWDRPEFVRVTGSLHGAFFLLFCLAIALQRWPLQKSMLAFVSAFLPFGPMLFERRYLGGASK